MRDCPELKDLAHFVETGEADPGLLKHLDRCDACQEARASLEDEGMSLQISISELWFREQISCPDAKVLERYQAKSLPADERSYVEFHLKTLECPTCQGRLDEAEVARSTEAKARARQSRKKVADASIRLLGEMRKKPR